MKTLIITSISILFSYLLFTSVKQEPIEETIDYSNEPLSPDFKIITCQKCRKLKEHREVLPRVWECTKCKRTINLT